MLKKTHSVPLLLWFSKVGVIEEWVGDNKNEIMCKKKQILKGSKFQEQYGEKKEEFGGIVVMGLI